MNGTDPNGCGIGAYPSVSTWNKMAYSPLALEKVIKEWKMQSKIWEEESRKDEVEIEEFEFDDEEDLPEETSDGVKVKWWDSAWIPFAGNGAGDYYCIDLSPSESGTAGQIITHSHETGTHKLLAPSLCAYLSDLADAFESGKFEYDCRYGVVRTEVET